MRDAKGVWGVLAFGLLAAGSANAQTPVDGPTGSISGHVSLSDTNGPARFAHVLLKRVPDASAKPADASGDVLSAFAAMLGVDDDDGKKGPAGAKAAAKPKKPADPDEQAATGAFAQIMSSAEDMLTSATVDASGAYTLNGLKPGTYYLHAILPGYVDPLAAFSNADLASTDPAMRQKIQSSLQTVTVSGQVAIHQDIKLELGAAVSGRVLFDDGSPAAGWRVTVVPVKKSDPAAAKAGPGFSMAELPDMTEMLFKVSHTTDDRGGYRVAGLPAGEYVVSATLTTANASGGSALTGGQMRLTVYSGNVMGEQDAKPVDVGNGDDHRGVDLVVPMSKLHSISGRVLAKLDGHVVNTGSVTMHDDSETSVLKSQVAALQSDGTFRFDYVPSGHYTLKIRSASLTEATGGSKKLFGMEIPKTKTLRKFGPGDQKVMLGDSDVSGVTFSLPEMPVEKPDMGN
jgi:hypothetical protein